MAKGYQITFDVDDKEHVNMHSTKPITLEDFMTLFCSASLGFMRQMLAKAPK